MQNKMIAPILVGQGMAGQAILKSLAIVSLMDPDLKIAPVQIVPRGMPLHPLNSTETMNVLFLAGPSGLHAKQIVEGDAAGFHAIAVEKPVCVRSEELDTLSKIRALVTVFHGYRVLWGTQTIKQMIDAGELGEIFSFEARYWQSSAAGSSLENIPEKRIWKNCLDLNGPTDALVDLGSHVTDICLYLMADVPLESKCWLGYRNAIAPHRDTHIHLTMKFPGDRRALASISKTVHGASNNLEYTVMGSRGTATWCFLTPDEIKWGSGNCVTTILRETNNPSSGAAPFHGLGWLEGYVEITRHTLRLAYGLDSIPIPTLKEASLVMQTLLNAERL
jgi:predicted dehydrogenase